MPSVSNLEMAFEVAVYFDKENHFINDDPRSSRMTSIMNEYS